MNKFALVLLFLSLASLSAEAATEIQMKEAEIAFSLPDTWETNGISNNRVAPKMDSSDPLYVAWKRTAIADKDGTPVTAGLNVTVFNVPSEANVVLISNALMHRRGWPFKEFLTTERDGLKFPNALGYLTEFSAPNGVAIKLFVVHSINNGKFVELTLSATAEIFSQVAPEFRGILKSLRLAAQTNSATPPSISLDEIEVVKSNAVAVSSIETTGTGVRIVIFASSTSPIANFMRQLDSAGAINVRLSEVHPVTACGKRISRAELEIDGTARSSAASGSAREQPLRIRGLDGKEFQCVLPASL